VQYTLDTSRRFRKALKKYRRSGQFNEEKLRKVVSTLQQGNQLDRRFRDHKLKGDMAGFREYHIESDLLLVYQIDEDAGVLILADLGSHADLFGS
jgi:mRNA interferase YafQ